MNTKIQKLLWVGLFIIQGFAHTRAQEVTDTDRNLVSSTTYDISGTVKSAGVTYYNRLGKALQTQGLDIKTGKIWASQILYGKQGRPILNSLSAPIGIFDTFQYRSHFILKPNGSPYTISDLENNVEDPSSVGNQNNTLGWYYSEQNTDEPYQDITLYPFTRILYDDLNPGNVRKVIGGNKISIDEQEQWVSSFSHTLPAAQELYYAFGRHYFPSDREEYEMSYNHPTLSALFEDENAVVTTLKAHKTVHIDPHGVENVVFTDADGKMLAAARSGEGPQKEVLSLIGPQGYVDIHIAKGCEAGISYLGGIENYIIYDLRSGEQIVPSPTLQAGMYRLQTIDPEDTPPVCYIDAATGSIHPAIEGAKGIRYRTNYYDYSLNEYDTTGRLTATLQPLGFNNNYTLDQASPAHNDSLKSTFNYNALGQLMETTSPDEGTARFKYRKDGQIRYSQNSIQEADGTFSYTNYDTLGRPVESGVLEGANFNTADPNAPLPEGLQKEQHFTVYDVAETIVFPEHSFTQSFTAGNVAKTYTQNPATTTTWYSYDIYGRVKWMIQDIEGLGKKILAYEYDPVSGNVVRVKYQDHEATERFIHSYTYNEADELVRVETSTDDVTYVSQAEYTYYETGALKRIDIANGLQGVDYVYNLAGQLKSINHPSLDPEKDPGGDANDAFGMAIDYHSRDYIRNLSNIAAPTYGTDQLNGNIKGLRWNNAYQPLEGAQNSYHYQYNRNQWLTDAIYGQYVPAEGTPGSFNADATEDYRVGDITYDANGNIQSLSRNKNTENNSNVMDALTYSYYSNGNRLQRVDDSIGEPTNTNDIKDQDGDNYIYNEIGQLVENIAEGIAYTYNAAGLVTEIRKNTVPLLRLYYNDRGQRFRKESYHAEDGSLIQTTHYVRDAVGNVVGIYNNTALTEQPIYGSSRLGIYFRTYEQYAYQLTDHLGNVRAVVNTEGISSATDYYPFGSPMPERHLQDANGYRYAYQGQEKDPETGKEAFQLRLWDSRIGRWLTTDPYGQYSSPYLGMGNNPISRIDPNGGEDWHYDKDGNLVSDAGDNAQTLANFKGISLSEAQNIIASEGFFTDYTNGMGTNLMVGQIAKNREFGSPYNINQTFSFSQPFSTDYTFSSWGKTGSTFRPRGTGGGITVAGGLDMSAYVTYSNGNHFLNISATATINNDPRNKVNSFLNVKYVSDKSSNLATKSLRIEPRGETVLTQAGTLYVGSQILLLPNNPNEMSRLNMTLGVHQRLPAGGTSQIDMVNNLLPIIIY